MSILDFDTSDWSAAACAGAGKLHFPDSTDHFDRKNAKVAKAKANCAVCPILDACAAYASVSMSPLWGVWAGTLYEDGKVRDQAYCGPGRKPKAQARPFRAGIAAALRPGPALRLDVRLNHGQWGTASGRREVRRGPKVLAVPNAFLEFGVVAADQPRANALEGVDEFGELHGWRVLDEQVNVVVFPVARGEHDIEVFAYLAEGAL
jgi:hypothetical protein